MAHWSRSLSAPHYCVLALAVLACSLSGCPAGNSSQSWRLTDATKDGPPDSVMPDVGPPVNCPVSATLTTETLATCLFEYEGAVGDCTAYLPGSTDSAVKSAAHSCEDWGLATIKYTWSSACCPSGWFFACRVTFGGAAQIGFNYEDKTAAQAANHIEKCKAVGGEVIYP